MEGLMTDNEDEALTLRPMIWRPSSLEETLILEKIVGRRGNKRMRLWDGITYSKDMHLRKLHEIVKDREACCVAKHVITKSQTWLSNWTIPMRTQGPVKDLVLVGVEKDLVGRGDFPGVVAQWWRTHLPVQDTWDQSLIQEDPTRSGTTKPLTSVREYWNNLRLY